MPLESSPSIKELETSRDGTPPEAPKPKGQRRGFWTLILVLLLLVLGLAAAKWIKEGGLVRFAGTGVVTGVVVDETGQPLPAVAIILGTALETQAGADGRFELGGVPAGDRILVIGYKYVGWEYPIRVEGGATVDVGRLVIEVPLVPGELPTD